ncbi:ABC transporter permease [Brockia lithotrophica]|uniref:ABC-type multidrug transport system permease subunit n=1 Tax=Brockia lithotrophica TaxID=933949 RepID=A0A660L841_9BACL|nr:ABC transporter permease [Brockia lithotrophica]RKQ89029.1 ABC-type multidrug transport system permease subunit [Brockia lithotrophica]
MQGNPGFFSSVLAVLRLRFASAWANPRALLLSLALPLGFAAILGLFISSETSGGKDEKNKTFSIRPFVTLGVALEEGGTVPDRVLDALRAVRGIAIVPIEEPLAKRSERVEELLARRTVDAVLFLPQSALSGVSGKEVFTQATLSQGGNPSENLAPEEAQENRSEALLLVGPYAENLREYLTLTVHLAFLRLANAGEKSTAEERHDEIVVHEINVRAIPDAPPGAAGNTSTDSAGSLSRASFPRTVLALALFFSLYQTLGDGAFLAEERALGTWMRFRTLPASESGWALGHLGGIWLGRTVELLLVLALASVFFSLPIANPSIVATAGALFVLIAAGAGVFMGSFFPNVAAYRAFAILLAVVSAMLSGTFWPPDVVSPTMQTLAAWIPQSWAVDALLVGTSGGSWGDAASVLSLLTGVAVGSLLLGTWSLHRALRL